MKIKNKIYENQKVFVINPVKMQIKIVWISNVNPNLSGWFIMININVFLNKSIIIIMCKISRNSLSKILILEIKDK